MCRTLPVAALLSIVCTAAGAGTAPAKFSLQDVQSEAKALAAKPYKEQPLIPRFMRELSYTDYQNIRFDPEKSLWQDSHSHFQVMLVPPGLYYSHPVRINVVDGKSIRPLTFNRELFTFSDPELGKRIPPDLGYAGFKLTYPLQGANSQNQFLVFAGASYFRGVGRDNAWGISTRGLAIDTGLPSGEDFPNFTEVWLMRPTPDANEVIVYGLLDSPNVTGAYQFTVMPGTNLLVKVKASLYPRKEIKLFGIAPLTSMFYYGENTARPTGEWRVQVHDSDGLLIENGVSGEWLWRPLINPKNLQVDYLSTENVRGFGLLQRDNTFAEYQDLAARYHERPSTWVEPQGDWNKGKIVLVQIPTPDETNDNIVAFWTPDLVVKPGVPLNFAYNLYFGSVGIVDEPMGRAINTFVGDGNVIGGGKQKGAVRFIVDFAGGELDKISPKSTLTGTVTALEDGEMIEQYVEYNPALKAWRLSILARPDKGKALSLRAFLSEGDKALTETWTYRLPPENDILTGRE